MHALPLYLDTSVIGGYYDAEFMADTRALWRLREAGHFSFVTSQLVFQEIAGAPQRVREPTSRKKSCRPRLRTTPVMSPSAPSPASDFS